MGTWDIPDWAKPVSVSKRRSQSPAPGETMCSDSPEHWMSPHLVKSVQALQDNNTPYIDHGIETLYRFAGKFQSWLFRLFMRLT